MRTLLLQELLLVPQRVACRMSSVNHHLAKDCESGGGCRSLVLVKRFLPGRLRCVVLQTVLHSEIWPTSFHAAVHLLIQRDYGSPRPDERQQPRTNQFVSGSSFARAKNGWVLPLV